MKKRTETEAAFVTTFDSLTRTEMNRSGCNRQTAIRRVARREPQLHAQYLQAINRNKPVAGALVYSQAPTVSSQPAQREATDALDGYFETSLNSHRYR